MAIDTSLIPGWESPSAFSLRSAAAASSIGSTFNSAFQAAANRKQQKEQYEQRKEAAVEAEAKRIIKVMGLGEQLSKILGPQEKLPGPTGEGMGSDTGSNEATWERRSAQDNFKNLLGAVAENPYWMADKDLRPVVEGVLKSTGELAQIETKAKQAEEALTNNTQSRQIATSSIANFRTRLAKLPKVTGELNAVLASGAVPTKEQWDMLDLEEANQAAEVAKIAAQKAELQSLNQFDREARIAAKDAATQKRYDSLPVKEYQKNFEKAEVDFAKASKLPKYVKEKDEKGKMVEVLNEKRTTGMAQAQAEIDLWKSKMSSRSGVTQSIKSGARAIQNGKTYEFDGTNWNEIK